MPNHPTKIQKLIEELCPNGMKLKSLSEIGTMIRGNGLKKSDFTESGIGCIHYGQIYTYYGNFADTTKTFVSPELAKKLKKAGKGDVLITGISENIADICKPLGWLGDEICISNHIFAFRHNQNTKFITYLLQTANFRKYKERYAQGSIITYIKAVDILNYTIPLPPLIIQEEIVKILDAFTELQTELQTKIKEELELRNKQYNYYLNKLLTFDIDD